jgi:hypothetical protein
MMRVVLAFALLAAACHRTAPDDSLAGYLDSLAGADKATRQAAVASWKLDRDAWDRVTTDPYRDQYAAYADQIDLRASGLVARLATRGAITTRPHFAGDPKLTIGQARARWAQPVAAPSEVAELDGVPLDVVFVRDGEHWRAIVGIDLLIFSRTIAKDRACGVLASGQVKGNCADFAWQVADAVLRDDAARLERACAQLASLCPSPR